MELYLIRHAQSVNNERPQEQRVEDPPLTDLGHVQAAHVARWIPSLKLTRLFTSPFLRTLQTAEYIRKSTHVTPEVWIDLHERGGCVSGSTLEGMVGRPGMTQSEIKTRFPAFHVTDEIDGKGWWRCQPYESNAQAERRAGLLLKKTHNIWAQTDERVVYVTHGDFKRLFLERFHSESLDIPYNGSVTKVVITPNESQLADYDSVHHLPMDLITQ